MRSERAREYLEHRRKSNTVAYASALEAIRIVEEEAEEALQALRDRFAADIRNLVERWDESDKKIDQLWFEERERLLDEIERYKERDREAGGIVGTEEPGSPEAEAAKAWRELRMAEDRVTFDR